MKTTRKRSPHGLVIAETCGQIHIRTATVRFPAFGRVLTDEGLRWAPDLGEGDGELVAVGDPSVRDLRVWVGDEFTQGDAGRVVRALQRHGIEAYGYEPQYRRDGEGPFVQYRRSGPMPMTRAGVVFNIDFGFEDGSWYFGSPLVLGRVGAILQQHCREFWPWVDARGYAALAVHASDPGWRRANRAIEASGIAVYDDVFRPVEDG
ncbi:hypothetical protein FB389_1322 [Rarobacter incanus]|uniref:Uncharacterized protein n=2 Tax=Rarobacter incanus TaxID=153494 RepID=A0A542SR01_9MICO|nr:hypothetical protein FB389_1322 [Rarobacter incanus]